ncbi:hypothetical protein ACLESO_18800 [Pyxidicoccus sp. 3LG]
MKQEKSLALAVVLLVSEALAQEGVQSPERSEAETIRPARTMDARELRLHDATNNVDTLESEAPPPFEPARDKLAARGSRRSGTLGSRIVVFGGMFLFMACFCFLVSRLLLAMAESQKKQPRASSLLPRSEELEPLEQRLKQASAALVQVEQALLRKENASLRVRFDQARKAEQNARQSLESFCRGIASRPAVTLRIDKVHKKAEAALADARRLLDEQA